MSLNPLISHNSPAQPVWASAFNALLPGTNLQVSTLTVAQEGQVILDSDNYLTGAAIQFNDDSSVPIFMRNVGLPDINQAPVKGVGLTFDDGEEADPQYAPLGAASFTIMGDLNYSLAPAGVLRQDGGTAHMAIDSARVFTSNMWVSTLNGAPVGAASLPSNAYFSNIYVSQSTITDSLRANKAFISSAQISSLACPYISSGNIFANNLTTSSINGQVINFSTTSGGSALFSSLITNSVSSVFGDFTFNLVSTLAFNPDFGGQKFDVNLGLGNWLSGILGGAASGLFNTIIAGAALGTGIAALVNTRGSGNINSSNFEMVAGQTQLQISTLGQSTISYLRLVSSINPQQIAGRERIVSSIIQAGTTCIRSLSDPINPASPSTATSTIQSFGSWVPIPIPTPTPENVSTISFASISSLTVSSINGYSWSNLPGGGGGGGGSFDFNAAMENLSTTIQWSDAQPPYDRIITATTNAAQYVSSGFLRVFTGNNSGGYGDNNLNGILNWRVVPSAFAGAQFETGEITVVPTYQPIISSLLTSTMITLRNNTPAVAGTAAYLEVIQSGGKGADALNVPGMTQPVDYGSLVVNDLFFSTMTNTATTINAGGNINVNCATFAINCNANGTGLIYATQAAPSQTCNINYHNIGGCFLGYYGYGSCFLPLGFQTNISALVFNGGVAMCNGWINAYNTGSPVALSSRINQQTFDYYAGMGGLQLSSNVANGQNVLTGQAIWRPGTYLCHLSVGANGSNFPASFRYLHVFRVAPGNVFNFSWQIIAESGCYWNMASYPQGAPGTAITFWNTCGSTQPFVWSISGLNYLEGTQ